MTFPWAYHVPIIAGDRKALTAMCNLKGIEPTDSNFASQIPELREFVFQYPHLGIGGSYEEELIKLRVIPKEKVEKKSEDSPKIPFLPPWHPSTPPMFTPHHRSGAIPPWQTVQPSYSEVTYNGVPIHSHPGYMSPGDAIKLAQQVTDDKKPTVNNINVKNVGHGTFHEHSYSTANKPEVISGLPPHMTPKGPIYHGTPLTYHQFYPYPTPPASPPKPALSYSRPTQSTPSDPFSTSKHHPVLSVSANPLGLSPKQASQIQLHPSLRKWPNPYPLAVDLRLSKSSIKYNSSGEKEDKEWKDDDAPATIPMMDEIVLVTPFLKSPIKVKNPRGVTCGDVFQTIFDTLQRPTPEIVWEKMSEDQRAHVMASWYSHREPMCTGSTLPDHALTNIDLLFDNVCFFGLYRDDEAAKAKLGFADPRCFVMELNRPLHKKEQYGPWTGMKRPFGW
ncbi:hypothetical protein FRC02_000924 [Tulasnella sp. 418]|nr:hypothetical protein FRC02_000924 [Tulasnella sp. 418]